MNVQTAQVVELDEQLDAEMQQQLQRMKLGEISVNEARYIPIPAEEAERVRAMNRRERRAWIADWKRKMRKEAKHGR